MELGLAIHKAIDFFFCDRCPVEVIEGRFSDSITHFCPFARFWDWGWLPAETYDPNHPIYFPRSCLVKITGYDQGLQKLGPEKYPDGA